MLFDTDRNDVTTFIECLLMKFSICVVTLSGYCYRYTVYRILFDTTWISWRAGLYPDRWYQTKSV